MTTIDLHNPPVPKDEDEALQLLLLAHDEEAAETKRYRESDVYKRVGLSQHPRRREMLMLLLETRQRNARFVIPYDRIGSLIDIQPPQLLEGKFEGRYADLLYREPEPDASTSTSTEPAP